VRPKLKSYILACLLGFASLQPANADSLTASKKAAPTELPASFNWDGPYFGAFTGVGFGDGSRSTIPAAEFNVVGAQIGALAGWNFQFSQTVVGFESDVAWTNLRGSVGGCLQSCDVSLDLLSTYRGRIGYSVGSWLPFATVGLAVGDIRTDRNEFRAGFAVGGGLEYAVNRWVVARFDYLHVDFRGFSCGSACSPATPNDARFQSHNFRVGLVIPFWPKPKPCDPDDPGPRLGCMTK